MTRNGKRVNSALSVFENEPRDTKSRTRPDTRVANVAVEAKLTNNKCIHQW